MLMATAKYNATSRQELPAATRHAYGSSSNLFMAAFRSGGFAIAPATNTAGVITHHTAKLPNFGG